MTVNGASGNSVESINALIAAEMEKAEQLEIKKIELEAQIRDAQGDMGDMAHRKRLIEQQIEVVQERINALRAVITLQEEAIESKQAEIESLERDIEQTEFEIEDRGLKIAALEAENEDNKRKFALIVKNEYMAGGQGFMNMLLSSGDFFDLVLRSQALLKAGEMHDEFMNDLLSAINEQDNLISELEDLKLKLAEDVARSEREKAELEDEKALLLVRMAELDAEMDAEQSKLRSHASDIIELQAIINNMHRQYNATNEEIEAANILVTQLIQSLQNPERPDYSGEGFIWPLDDRFRRITCDYGWDAAWGRWHTGIDVGNSGISGASIYAVQSGTVIRAEWIGGYGNTVIIDHGGGVSTLYAHIQSNGFRVSAGDQVRQGEVVGLVGSTGWSTGAHLHFEVRVNGSAVDPWDYL
jgi:murein DD-endopeptidase MepM/ murein hydrolase activator NlpD